MAGQELDSRLLTVVDCCLNLAKINKAIQPTKWGPTPAPPSSSSLGVRKVLSLAKLTFRTPNENEIVFFFALNFTDILQKLISFLIFFLVDVLDS